MSGPTPAEVEALAALLRDHGADQIKCVSNHIGLVDGWHCSSCGLILRAGRGVRSKHVDTDHQAAIVLAAGYLSPEQVAAKVREAQAEALRSALVNESDAIAALIDENYITVQEGGYGVDGDTFSAVPVRDLLEHEERLRDRADQIGGSR